MEVNYIKCEKEPEKTPAMLEKEAKKLQKMHKLELKKEKMAQQQASETDKKKKQVKDLKVASEYDANTQSGEKKDVTNKMPEAYNPKYVEAAWYAWWEKSGFFKPEYNRISFNEENPKGKFMMVIPPPNVTGSLHLGHALTNSIEDAITRWHRMHGKTVLWNPGCDHAGIATQVVVEKKLWKEKGLSRHDLGREAFVDEIWKWKNAKGDRIYHQLRILGGSYDWDRVCFTMDPKLNKAVTEAFIRMHDNKIIYRSNRLVNWSCSLNSAISDIEVDKKELTGRTMLTVPNYDQKIEFGVLVTFAYPIEDSEEFIEVATTRVETMLGDTAVAVHPSDTRYSHLIGQKINHPFVDRQLPIIADEMVDTLFGTGAVKITPAHDQNDYECGKRHNLPFVNILNDDGTLNASCGSFAGMKRFNARTAITDALKEKKLYRDTKDNAMVVPTCSRSKDIIEPLLKPQWYVNCQEMAENAVNVVKNGELKLFPDTFVKTWYQWLDNCRDWCISRQLWWGHRVPAYFVTVNDGSLPPGDELDNNYWVSGKDETEAKEKAAKKFNVDVTKISLKQDEDVLDTWFSSGLFPFSVLGWPDQTEELKYFYPGSLLETGHDILFFWVARMVMMGLHLLGKLPFTEVYLHSIIRDKYGRKMSKSLGNVLDPLDIIYGIQLEDLHKQLLDGNLDPKEIEKAKDGQKAQFPQGIPECGTDALRFALCAYATQGRDINLDILRVQGYRFFCNKIWNATKFVLSHLSDNFTPKPSVQLIGNESHMDEWILSRLSFAVEQCNQAFCDYDFPLATTTCYNFWLYDLCDIYLEYSKGILYGQNEDNKNTIREILYTCLDAGLRLIHPFMIFLTEELFQRLTRRADDKFPSIMVSPYPEKEQYKWRNEELEHDVEFTMDCVKTIRSMRSDYQLNKQKTKLFLKCSDVQSVDILTRFKGLLTALCSASDLIIFSASTCNFIIDEGCAIQTVSSKCEVYMLLKGIIDFVKESEKLEEKKVKLETQKNDIVKLTGKTDYFTKVPEQVRVHNSEKIEQYQKEIEQLTSAIQKLNNMK